MAKNRAICIARQFGSGGHEVGLALSRRLDIPFYDKELLARAAEKSGILQELFEKNDETAGALQAGAIAAGAVSGKAASYADWTSYMPGDRMQNAIADVIREKAAEGDCVIIGRCADYVLRGLPGTMSVFVHAPLEVRIKRIQRMHNLDEDAARALIRKTDRARANYYSYYTDRDWNAVESYDLAVDAGRLGVKAAAELLAACVPIFTGGE